MLPPDVQGRFASSTAKVLRHYNALSSLARAEGRGRTWHQVPKFHFMQHLALQARVQNPKFSWTYIDEDFMGIMRDIASSCSAGTALGRVVSKVCEKWRLGVGLRVSRQ